MIEYTSKTGQNFKTFVHAAQSRGVLWLLREREREGDGAGLCSVTFYE